MVPNMDAGTSGCSNAVGIGPRPADPAAPQVPNTTGIPVVLGLTPAEAATVAAALGHTVVFRVGIDGFGECWCVPPPEGKVVDAWWTEKGALMLDAEGVEVGHTAGNQPGSGWGC